MDNEELTKRVFEIDEKIARHTEQLKTCFNQIAEARSVTDSVHKLATTVEILARELQSTNSELKETNRKIDKAATEIEEIKEKPAKHWENVVSIAITAVVTAIMTYFLTAMGLK